MRFTKMHGAGNDFIIINNIIERIPEYKMGALAKKLCERRTSLGADGFMAVDNPSNGGDFKMRFYNSDGSLGEMCGNGARCIARYGYENDLAGNVQKIETTAGMVIGYRLDTRKYKVKLNDISRMDLDLDIDVDGKKYTVSYVELGNPGIPHAVVYIEGLADADRDELFELGRKLRYHKHFEKGANVNFYDIVGEDQVVELTYERGVEDFTLACGTGTGSVVSVLTQQRKVSGNDVKVSVPGGELMIDIIKDGKDIKDIFLIGPTNIVAEGEILDEDL